MAASIISSSAAANVVFGCTAETGIIISAFGRDTASTRVEVPDNDGDIVAIADHGFKANISIEGTLNGTTGVAAFAPGVAATLAGNVALNGVSGGTVVTDSTSRKSANQDFVKFSAALTQYPSLG